MIENFPQSFRAFTITEEMYLSNTKYYKVFGIEVGDDVETQLAKLYLLFRSLENCKDIEEYNSNYNRLRNGYFNHFDRKRNEYELEYALATLEHR